MGGSTKSSTTQTNSPPAWAAPLFKQSGTDAMSLYNSGQGGNNYPGTAVADLSGTTMQGVNQLAQAGQGWDTSGSRELLQGLGAASVDDSWLKNGNPYYKERLNSEIQDANDLIKSSYSGAGRYGGSFADTNAVAKNTTNMLLSGLENDYNRERGYLNSGMDRALQATQGIAGLDQQNFQNRLQGAGATLQAGGIVDDQAQKQLSDAIAQWYGGDNEGWNRLGMLQSAAAGAAGPYGTQTANSKSSSSPGIGQIAGGVGALMGK